MNEVNLLHQIVPMIQIRNNQEPVGWSKFTSHKQILQQLVQNDVRQFMQTIGGTSIVASNPIVEHQYTHIHNKHE